MHDLPHTGKVVKRAKAKVRTEQKVKARERKVKMVRSDYHRRSMINVKILIIVILTIIVMLLGGLEMWVSWIKIRIFMCIF